MSTTARRPCCCSGQAVIDQIIADKKIAIVVWQLKYLNNVVEQDNRAVKRVTC